MKVKICGIKTIEAAQAASDAGADFLGFNFVRSSKRYIEPKKAKEILDKLSRVYSSSDPPTDGESRSSKGKFSTRRVPYGNPSSSDNIKIVGVFMDEEIDIINKLIHYLKLDYVQLHGNELPEYSSLVKGARIIKTFSLHADFNVEETIKKMKKYKVDYFLLDREVQGRGGLLNPKKVRELTSISPIILGGGLTVGNVDEVIRMAKPQGVDVAGGVETDGEKDKEKIRRFIQAVKDHYSSSDERSEESRSLIEKFSTRRVPYGNPSSSNNKKGYFGQFGGQFVSELLYTALLELDKVFFKIKKDKEFNREYKRLLQEYAGRPTPLYFAQNTSEFLGFKVYFKREDLVNGGSHKLNNALGQVLLAKYLEKKFIVTETAAGMHGVAATMAANVVGLKCKVFMGIKDIERQRLNYEKIKLLGGEVIPVTRGAGVLKDAVSEAQVAWIRDLPNTHYLIGSTVGPHPFPTIVSYFQKVIGEEARKQILAKEKKLPKAIIACGSGGSNALGIFQAFLEDKNVELIFVEGEESAAFKYGSIGVFQGTKTYVLQDEFGMDRKTTSRAAGLNYPARGPQLSYLVQSGRVKTFTANNNEVLEAFKLMGKLEGLLPALETCHAIVELFKRKGKYKLDDIVILNFSGRGDKDIETVIKSKER